MMLVDLLDDKRFGLRLLEDPLGDAAGRPVTRVFSTDQPEPRRYMSGGELVLTGLIFHAGDEHESEAFVASIVEGGAIAIGAGLDRFGHIPDHLRMACTAHGIPLFSVPADVSFADITQVFIDRAAQATRQARQSLSRSRELLTAVGAGRALDDIAATVVTATGVHCWVLTAGGKRVAAVGNPLTDDNIDRLVGAAAGATSLPTAVDRFTILAAGGRRDRCTAWYLVIEAHAADLSHDAMEAFNELAAMAALIRARNADADFVHNIQDDAVIARLLAGEHTEGGMVVVVDGAAMDSDVTPLRSLVRDAVVANAGAVVGVVDGSIVAFMPGSPPTEVVVAEIRRHLERALPLLNTTVRVGVSEVVEPGGVGGAYRSAVLAARLGTEPLTVTYSSALGSALTLLTRLPDDVRAEFVERVLGPVRRYDERTSAGLLPMLREFLAQGGSWVRTADSMHLHPNSVRYRINKIEELTGRNLSAMDDRVDVHLALSLS